MRPEGPIAADSRGRGGARFPTADAATIARIADDMARDGYARLEGVISAASIAEARAQAEAAVAANGGEYVAITGSDGLAGWLLAGIHADPAFHAMLAGLYRAQTGRAAASGHVHQVLRCLQGRTARNHAGYLHYDSYAVTIIVPLAIPAGGGGELVLLPDHRRRRGYLLSAIEKLLLDRAPVQRRLWRRIDRPGARAVRLVLEPGTAYIFAGDRTLHANAPSDPAGLRATLLYHYGNPHAASVLRRWRRP